MSQMNGQDVSESLATESQRQMSSNNSAAHLPTTNDDDINEIPEKRPLSSSKRRGLLFWSACAAAVIIIVLIIILPVYFTVIKPKHNNNATPTGSNSGGDSQDGNPSSSSPTSTSTLTTGGDGSTVTLEDGSSFTYSNKFGGFWVYDPNNPFNNDAQPNSWTPPLNTSWTWGKDKIYGVNLGGWLVLEPFISPALFQKYPSAVDEWTLSEAMAADTENGGLGQLENHYNTFITEKDIAEIAGAGLNWVRVAIPFWAIDVWPGEPFLQGTSWKYFLRLVGWCRKYGIRINLDLHTIPGSQNGLNHSGKLGQLNFLKGVMGVANAQRALNYLRIFTEFISQPQYKDVIVMFSIMNEAKLSMIGRDQLTSFYLQAHDMIRNITGLGTGNGPFIAIGDGFDGQANWAGFLTGSDRIALDAHPYFAFSDTPDRSPIDTGTGDSAGGDWPAKACNAWGGAHKKSQTDFGFTFSGEFSNGINDCGLLLRGVGNDPVFGDCTLYDDWASWDASMKAGFQAFAEASMDALNNWFFWTWKIGNSTNNRVEAPLWSYQLGLQNGWMPKDPRTASGKCDAVGVDFTPFSGSYKPWQTGGAGAGTIAASSTSQYPFPPASITGVDVDPTELPTYVPTGSITTLSPPTFTPTPTASVDAGSGWFNAQDTSGAYTTKAGCSYPDSWEANSVPVPTQC